ncbi:MAG: hypothetical protein LBR61_12815 [Synergistaceae bacterium]|jgi:Rod binding domain-containing protein|nr:hypothetical protein [Synergistaceae bacterium]
MTSLQVYNVRAHKQEISPEVHKTRDAQKLKEACQQFESILWAQIWKKMKTDARQMAGQDEKQRPWKQMEDLSLEMASEEIIKSTDSGLWKVLYDQLVPQVAATLKAHRGEDAEAENG